MDRDYWIKKWQADKQFALENDRLKKKSYIYTPFPKGNLYGFQNGDARGLIYADTLARYQRLQSFNVLFPTGCHSLCNTSFVENKKLSNVLNDDISEVFTRQMYSLGIGINDAKHIDMRHNEYLQNLQQAFLDLYSRGYIEYKDTKVYYDKKANKIYDAIVHSKELPTIFYKSFVLKVNNLIDDIVDDINQIDCSDDIKKKLLNCFKPKRVLDFELFVSNGAKLNVSMNDPEYMGGISFIFLNPDYIDIINYVDTSEYESLMSYLEGRSTKKLFAFTGLFARNPLTGMEIPIFISTMFQCDVYLGIPGFDEDDKVLAIEEELEVIELVKEGRMVNSDFLDGMSPVDANETIINAFIDADIAKLRIVYEHQEILLSSLDNFGPLFPFLEDKDSKEIFSLEGHLPYAFSSKMRPVLIDNVDIAGNTMNGTINNLFTEGMCPIISVLYDSIGSIIPMFSNEAFSELNRMNGISYLAIKDSELISSVLMPMIFYRIIEIESGKRLPRLFNKIELFDNIIDIQHKDIKRANNNLIDFDKLLAAYSSDAIRMFMVSQPSNEVFMFNKYQLEDIDNNISKLYSKLLEPVDDGGSCDYALFNLIKECNSSLEKYDVLGYAKAIEDFIVNYALEHGLSKKQTFIFIRLISPIMPFLAEEVYKEIFNGKYSLMNEDWPN
ncbi:MAG: hypothetical protein E7176_01735 [Erysipelotrichaceae bacterium]|nr:hypothetical protein [Erysipelotrichaceae bacterium]